MASRFYYDIQKITIFNSLSNNSLITIFIVDCCHQVSTCVAYSHDLQIILGFRVSNYLQTAKVQNLAGVTGVIYYVAHL